MNNRILSRQTGRNVLRTTNRLRSLYEWRIVNSDLRTALNGNLTNGALTFSRASEAKQFALGAYTTQPLNTPRFDETSKLPSAVLIEPAATQLFASVLDLNVTASWTGLNIGTPTALSDISGDTKMWRILETSATGVHEISQNVTLINNTTYVVGVTVRANGRGWIKILCMNNAGNTYFTNFNIDTGGVTAPVAVGSKSSQVFTSFVDLGGGLFRISMSFPASTGGSQASIHFQCATDDNITNYAGSATVGLDIYWPQLEVGFFPTSPIDNELVTRAKDVLSFPGSNNLSLGDFTKTGLYNTVWGDDNQGLGYFFGCAISGGVNRVSMQKLADRFRLIQNGPNASLSQLDVLSAGLWDANVWHHIAAVFRASGSIELYIDGVNVGGTLTSSGVWQSRTAVGTNFYLGADYNGNSQLVGRIALGGCYKGALNASQISAIAQAELLSVQVEEAQQLTRESRLALSPTSSLAIVDTTLGKRVFFDPAKKRWVNQDNSEIQDRSVDVSAFSNVTTNPEFNGSSGFSFSSAHYDASVSRLSDGTGSLRFDATNELMDGTAYFTIPDITQPISIKGYMKSSALDTYFQFMPKLRITPTSNLSESATPADVSFARNSTPGVWEEFMYQFVPGDLLPGATIMQLKMQRVDTVGSGFIWVDSLEIIFGDRNVYAVAPKPAANRVSFEGPESTIRTDKLGNTQLLTGGVWTDHFIFGIHAASPYTSANMTAWYPDFNSIWDNSIFSDDPTAMLRVASGAGIKTIAEIKGIALPVSAGGNANFYNNFSLLEDKIAAFVADPHFATSFLCWYMDDEVPHDTDKVRAAFELIRQYDPNFPIFTHLHHSNAHRNYLGSPISMMGGYISEFGALNNFEIADRLEGNPFPLCIGQLSFERTPGQFTSQFYRGLTMGMRGVKYYRDYTVGTSDYTTKGWLNSDAATAGTAATIQSEIAAMQMAGIVQAPHFADWRIKSSNQSVCVGIRQVDSGYPYLIVVNPYNDSRSVTLTLEGLSVGLLKDFHDGLTTVGTVTGRQTTLDLDPYQRYVLRGE